MWIAWKSSKLKSVIIMLGFRNAPNSRWNQDMADWRASVEVFGVDSGQQACRV